ncbi:MAG: hypothetical protein RLN74_15975 [Ilumatobacter fluminis]
MRSRSGCWREGRPDSSPPARGVGVAILAYQAVHHHLDRLDESGAAGGVAAQGA